MSRTFYKALGTSEEWPNITGIHPSSITYQDVALVPQISRITSRASVSTTVKLGPYTLTTPIISAPMDTITGEAMVRELARLGGIGTLPRGDIEKNSALCKQLSNENIPCVYTVGLKNGKEAASTLIHNGAKVILIDIAHGGMQQVIELAQEIKKKFNITIMLGNIATYEQMLVYKQAGIDIVKVGIGPGGLCTTRLVAGTGFPQLSALFETTAEGMFIIADGGIKTPGDMAKAIAAGANMVMIGSLFAGTDETPGETLADGTKIARGQASASYMKDNDVVIGQGRTAEGVTVKVRVKGPVSVVVEHLMGGLRSAMSYSDAETIAEFQKKAKFVLFSLAAQAESVPHIDQVTS